MKKILIYIIVFQFSSLIIAQNLVNNPSFEFYTQCPYSENQVSYCSGWQSCFGTPDYFNACFTTGSVNVGVPNNSLGIQSAFDGNAYCGFGHELQIGSRESISSQLITPLVIGKRYKVSFRVSLAESESIGYGTNKIGAYFTQGSPPSTIPNFAHVYTENVITETEDWVLLSGCFIADASYDFLNIGVFFENQYLDSNRITVHSVQYNSQIAYYYIDFVEVIEDSIDLNCNSIITDTSETISEIYIPNIFSPNNDGINDIFKITGVEGQLSIQIFNRWGEKIYFTKGFNCFWNGYTNQGTLSNEGVYFYLIRVENKTYKGFFHLIR